MPSACGGKLIWTVWERNYAAARGVREGARKSSGSRGGGDDGRFQAGALDRAATRLPEKSHSKRLCDAGAYRGPGRHRHDLGCLGVSLGAELSGGGAVCSGKWQPGPTQRLRGQSGRAPGSLDLRPAKCQGKCQEFPEDYGGSDPPAGSAGYELGRKAEQFLEPCLRGGLPIQKGTRKSGYSRGLCLGGRDSAGGAGSEINGQTTGCLWSAEKSSPPLAWSGKFPTHGTKSSRW